LKKHIVKTALFVKKYQILFCFFIAFILAKFMPQTGIVMEKIGLLKLFIIIMFICIGLTFDKSKIGNIYSSKVMTAIIWALIASVLLGPLISFLIAKELHLSNYIVIGLILITSAPPTLVAGPIISEQLGANFEIATAISTIVKLFSIFLIPSVLVLFLGTVADINQIALIKEMIILIIIPGLAGQAIRSWKKSIIIKVTPAIAWVVTFSNFILAYIAFSTMHNELQIMTFKNILIIACPCIAIHFIHIFLTARFAKYTLRIEPDIRVSLTIAACQKNMAIPLSIWTMCFIKTYPASIIVVVIYYLVQFFIDSSFLIFRSDNSLSKNKK
jgi:predicted Na+-dependent transporter